MWAFINSIRRQAKLGIAILAWDLMFLIAILLTISASIQQIMHPAIAIVGALWITFTAGAIWHSGGVIVDSAILARVTNTEIGKELARALNIFFMLGATTVVFFFLFPVWKFWAGTFILPVLLVGLLTSANLAGEKTNWNMFYKAYSLIIAVLLLAFVFIGLTGWRPETTDFSGFLGNWISRLALLGALFIVLSFMPFISSGIKSLLKPLGGLFLLISLILLIFPEINPASGDLKTFKIKSAATATKMFVAEVPPGKMLVACRETDEQPVVVTDFEGEQYIFDNRDVRSPSYWQVPGRPWNLTNSDPGRNMKVYFFLRPGQKPENFTVRIADNPNLSASPKIIEGDEW